MNQESIKLVEFLTTKIRNGGNFRNEVLILNPSFYEKIKTVFRVNMHYNPEKKKGLFSFWGYTLAGHLPKRIEIYLSEKVDNFKLVIRRELNKYLEIPSSHAGEKYPSSLNEIGEDLLILAQSRGLDPQGKTEKEVIEALEQL